MTAAVTVPVVGAGIASVKAAANFEQGMAQVQATMGLTKDATTELNGENVKTMDALGELAQKMGKETKFSATEAAAAINNMAMAGYDTQKIYDTLPTTLSLAAAGGLDLDYATQLVANGMAVMGESAGSAQRMADMLAVTASSAYGSVSDFGEGLLVAGGQAAVCGQSIEDTYTALGILGDAGIQGSEGGTALRNTLKNLYQPSDKAAKTLSKLGIKTSDAEGNLLSMQDVLQQLSGAFESMNDAEISTTMAEIFDSRTIGAATALIGNASGRWDELREKISGASDMYNGQGAAAGMAAVQMDTLEGRITTLKSATEGLAISFGNILIPVAEKVVQKAQELADKFNNLTPEQKEQIVHIAAMAAAIGPLLLGFGKLISTGAKLFGVFSKIRGAFTAVSQAGGVAKAVFAAFGAPLGVVIAVIAAVAAVIAVVITHLDQFKKAAQVVVQTVSPAIANLSAAFGQFGQLVSPIITFIGDLLANVLCGAMISLGAVASVVINGIATVFTALSGIISGVVSVVTGIINADWSATWEAAKSVVNTVVESIGGIITGISDTISNVVAVIMGIKDGDWSAVWNGMQGIVTGVSDVIKSALGGIKGVLDGIVSVAKKAGEAIGLIKPPAGGGNKGGALKGRASGTPNWEGGWVRVNERGGEIMNLPSGTQIIPHEASLNTPVGGGLNIAKLADQIIVREQADIDRIGDEIARRWKMAQATRGGYSYSGNMA